MPRNKRMEFPDFSKMEKGTQRLLDSLPVITGNMAVNFFKDRFRQKAWIDRGLVVWAPRKQQSTGSLLLKSGDLRDSIQFDAKKLQVIVSSDTTTSTNPAGYSQIHNEGGTIQVNVTKKMRSFFWAMYHKTGQERWKHMALTRHKSFKINIPQRQFMGHSDFLMKRMEMNFFEAIKKIEKQTFQ